MNILQLGKFYPPHPGGMETHLQALVKRLATNYSVDVLVANDCARSQAENRDGASVTRVSSLGVVASMPLTPLLSRELMRRSPDLIHVHTPNPGAAFALSITRPRCPLVVTHHSDIVGRTHLHRVVRPFNRRLNSMADRIIVTSQRYLETSLELVDHRHKCVVIPLGIDQEAFASPDPAEVAHVRRQLGEDVILAVGRLVPYKGFEHAVRSMVHVNATLAIIGTGPLERELRRLASDLNVTDKVRFLGAVCNLAPYYRAAKVLVVPSISRAEAFAIVQLEAMAAGVPIVNTDVNSGVPEVSVNGTTGLTVPPADNIALARALRFLLANEPERTKMGEAAQKRAAKEYSVEKMIARTVDLYESVLSSPAKPANERIMSLQ